MLILCFVFRAFLASPILRELSTVKQENRNIKVMPIIQVTLSIFLILG